jgi:metal-responsive CopG/Arc/MetJ family transcriptional regulator
MSKKKPEEKLKSKFSFCLEDKLLEKMDEYLEKMDINNRSKYIEKLVREDMKNRGKDVTKEF